MKKENFWKIKYNSIQKLICLSMLVSCEADDISNIYINSINSNPSRPGHEEVIPPEQMNELTGINDNNGNESDSENERIIYPPKIMRDSSIDTNEVIKKNYKKQTENDRMDSYNNYIDRVQNIYSMPINSIPAELRYGNPSYHPYFKNIPEIRNLQVMLEKSPLEKKGYYIAKIAALLGVQTREEILDVNGSIGIEKWNYIDPATGLNVPTCNTYSTTLIRALGIEDLSHWFMREGDVIYPRLNTGVEYQAKDMNRWLNEYGEEFGWVDVSMLKEEERLQMLYRGFVFYGANQTHAWVVFGMPNESGEVVPILSQSNRNILFGNAYGVTFSDPLPGTLFAHKLPHLVSDGANQQIDTNLGLIK